MFTPDTHWNKLQRKRGFLFRISLLISLSLVILAFSWTTYDLIHQLSSDTEEYDTYSDIEIIPVTVVRNAKKVAIPAQPVPRHFASINPTTLDDITKSVTNINVTSFIDTLIKTIGPMPDENFEEGFVPFVPFPEVRPQYKGGDEALLNYLSKVPYCDEAINIGVEGDIIVRFMVNEKGKVSNVGLENQLSPCIDKAAIRHVQNMPDWEPATQGGQAVKTIMRTRLQFTLN